MAARDPKPVMHSKHERNYLLATHGAAVAIACTHYGNTVGCEYCSHGRHYGGCNCSYNIYQAAATAMTTTTATIVTARTPTLRSNTSNTIMAYVNGQYAHSMHWGQCTLRLHAMSTAAATAPHSPQSGCKLQAANCKPPTANCKLCCYGTGIAVPTTRATRT